MRDGHCCSSPSLARDAGRRFFCSNCARSWSVSHSARHLIAARSENHVGVDIQSRVRREAALRWLGRVTNTDDATLEHWSAAEATLKALGLAGDRDNVAGLLFPQGFSSGWSSIAHVALTPLDEVEIRRGNVFTWDDGQAIGALALFE